MTRTMYSFLLHRFSPYLLVLPLVVFLFSSPVFSLEFVTKTEYDNEKTAFKNYPLKILFKKLAESRGAEKREIRNSIILKQVFEKGTREESGAGAPVFLKIFGVIKTMGEDTLRLWVPETGAHRDFHMGINRIPLENPENHPITAENIGSYTLVLSTLDERVYSIRIGFRIEVPEGLSVKREDDLNVINWSETPETKKPSGYRVFINGKLFTTVEDTSVRVPRTEGEVDRYHVEAVYEQNGSVIASEASLVLLDHITAEELRKKTVADETLDRVLATLNPSDWETGRKLLYENLLFMEEQLDQERKETLEDLAGFFNDMDEGDRLKNLRPATRKSIESALALYKQSVQKARAMHDPVDISFIPLQRINECLTMQAALEKTASGRRAEETFEQILGALRGQSWEKARQLLNRDRQFLAENLDIAQKDIVDILIDFFRDIDEGDIFRHEQPITIRGLGKALRMFKRAEQKTGSLPDDIPLHSLAELKINETLAQRSLLEEKNKEVLAQEIYDRIATTLTPSEWGRAKKILFDNRQSIAGYLDKKQEDTIAGLMKFFNTLDDGDRFREKQPESIKDLEEALKIYKNAWLEAEALSNSVNVGFIPEGKITEALERKALLEARDKTRFAEGLYDRIIASCNPSEWENAGRLLNENHVFMKEQLDPNRINVIDTLSGFFSDVETGDRLREGEPDEIKGIESALLLYKRAEQRLDTLPGSVELHFITRERIDESLKLKSVAEKRKDELLAEEAYEKIVQALATSDYETARNILYHNLKFMGDSLDDERDAVIEKLFRIFQDIDEGDRLALEKPETSRNLGKALRLYGSAEQNGDGLPRRIDPSSIIRAKTASVSERKISLEIREKELFAKETYDQILTALTPLEWEEGRELLYENQEILEEYLDPERKRNIEILMNFFHDIQEGDRASRDRPDTEKTLTDALKHYQDAGRMAKALPAEIKIFFISELKINNAMNRKSILESGNRTRLAGEIYERIVSELTPSAWENARKLLYDNRLFLEEVLEGERKKILTRLIDFFIDLNEGDKLAGLVPESIQNIDRATTLYKRAGQKAASLKDSIDVLFIAKLKISQCQTRKSQLKRKEAASMADAMFERITAGLTPSDWEKSKELLYDNHGFLEDHLDEERRDRAEQLYGFFRALDRVDQIREEKPETEKNLDAIIPLYEQTGLKAEALMPAIDIRFIAEDKVEKCRVRKVILMARKQEMLAAKEPKEDPVPQLVPEEIEEEEQPVITPGTTVDRPTLILMALKEFDARDYTSSMNHFLMVFMKQIENIRAGGKKRIRGVLGLPVECRAEIIFLTELDRLKRLNIDNDPELYKRGLEKIHENVGNRLGPWGIISSSSKINKIQHHIAIFDVGFFQ